MGLKESVLEIRENRERIIKQKGNEKFMKAALKVAQKAYDLGEVPIGCVIVQNDKIISRGYNRRNTDKNAASHAEMIAIKKACKKLGDWRLEDCVMYITLEPCPMCAGAIVQARIPKIVYGTKSQKSGCAGSVMNLLQVPKLNHQVLIEQGLLEDECTEILTRFFAQMRGRQNREKIDKTP